MKKIIFLQGPGPILIYIIIMWIAFCFLYFVVVPVNVVTGVPPVREISVKAKKMIDSISMATDKDLAIKKAISELPVKGKTLEEKISFWVKYEYSAIDSIRFKLLSGLGITATTAEKNVTGYVNEEVVVEIWHQGKMNEYFLVCANGLVTKKYPKLVKEIRVGKTFVKQNYSHDDYESEIKEIPVGGSLCKTLKMTPREALDCAREFNMKYWYKNDMLIVLVYPEDSFIFINNRWEPITLF